MNELKEFLHEAWLDGFKHGLYPGHVDPFDAWFATVDLKAWLIEGTLKRNLNENTISI